MRQAAAIYARLGYLRQYCDIMVEVGEWDRALAVAPAVSVPYWQVRALLAGVRARTRRFDQSFAAGPCPARASPGEAHAPPARRSFAPAESLLHRRECPSVPHDPSTS